MVQLLRRELVRTSADIDAGGEKLDSEYEYPGGGRREAYLRFVGFSNATW
jgi:hypothetical protein